MSRGSPRRPSGVRPFMPSRTFSGIVHHHLGGGKAGRHGVDADAVAAQLARPHLGHADHAGLGGDIVGLAKVAVQPDDRRGVEDHAAALADHVRAQRPGCS